MGCSIKNVGVFSSDMPKFGKISEQNCGIFLDDLLYALCILASFHKQDNAE